MFQLWMNYFNQLLRNGIKNGSIFEISVQQWKKKIRTTIRWTETRNYGILLWHDCRHYRNTHSILSSCAYQSMIFIPFIPKIHHSKSSCFVSWICGIVYNFRHWLLIRNFRVWKSVINKLVVLLYINNEISKSTKDASNSINFIRKQECLNLHRNSWNTKMGDDVFVHQSNSFIIIMQASVLTHRWWVALCQ